MNNRNSSSSGSSSSHSFSHSSPSRSSSHSFSSSSKQAERVQKLIAETGITSRRKAEKLIEQQRVHINGKLATLGSCAKRTDTITVDGKPIALPNKLYLMLHKPKGCIVTKHDPQGRKTIYDLPAVQRLPPVRAVGRLDAMSEGLLLLTNDGDWANRISHPRYEVEKTYVVRCEPKLTDVDVKHIENGMIIDGKRTLPAKVFRYEDRQDGQNQLMHDEWHTIWRKKLHENEVLIMLHEGRNRIIRKMLLSLGYKIYMLKRVQIGSICLGNLQQGAVQPISLAAQKDLYASPTQNAHAHRDRHQARFTRGDKARDRAASSSKSGERGALRSLYQHRDKPRFARGKPGKSGSPGKPGKPNSRNEPVRHARASAKRGEKGGEERRKTSRVLQGVRGKRRR